MRLVWTSIGSLALLAGCPTKDDGTPATDTDDSPGPSGSTVDTLTTEVTPTEPGATTTEVTDTGSTATAGTETTAAATDAATTTDTSSDTDTDTSPTDTDTEGEAVVCPEADPAADATFAVTLFDWPEAWTEAHFIDVMCTVDAVTLEGGMVVTALTCDHEGVPRPANVSIVAAPEGDVSWTAGDSVHLDSMALDDRVSVPTRAVTMRTPDKQQLLLVAVDGAEEADEPTRFEPLLYTIAKLCDEPGGDGGFLATVTLESPMGAALSLDSGTRGSFAADAGHVYAFDLVEAVVGACCHGNDMLQLLVRRVAIDG